MGRDVSLKNRGKPNRALRNEVRVAAAGWRDDIFDQNLVGRFSRLGREQNNDRTDGGAGQFKGTARKPSGSPQK